MSNSSRTELECFQAYVAQLLELGCNVSPESAVASWRDDLEAIREGLADVDAGRVRPLDEVVNEIRREHGWG